MVCGKISIMEKKRSVGVTIYGYGYIVLSVLTIAILLGVIYKYLLNIHVIILGSFWITFFLIDIIVLYFFLKLQNWARIFQICFWSLSIPCNILIYLGIVQKSFPYHESFIKTTIRSILGIIFLFFLTRPKVKEQFEK